MDSGHVFLTDDGMDLDRIDINCRNDAVLKFCNMRATAIADFFYMNNLYGFEKLYLHLYDNPVFWKGISNNTLQLLQQNLYNSPKKIDFHLFCKKSGPRTNGGFEYVGCPTTDYVYDCVTWERWHHDWNKNHTDCIDWEKGFVVDDKLGNIKENSIFPFKSKIMKIMKEELLKIKKEPVNIKCEHQIALDFHNLVVRPKSKNGEFQAYITEIADKICEVNCYRREPLLEKFEQERPEGNKKVERVYSFKKKNAKYIFLSLDTNHGMFEWCDDDGNHLGERKFDGSYNSDAEKDHSLNCVAEWKKKKNSLFLDFCF